MLYFTIEKRLQDGIGKVTEAAGARWRFYPRISSDYPRIFREFPMKSWASRFRGRRSIWWGWRVTWLAPRIGNEVSYVTQIIDDIHFAWQAQYLVRLEGDFTCSTHWKCGFIWAVSKTLLDFVKITWSFAMIFREPFATWVLAFASSNHSKVAFASFRGEYRENKCITIHHHVSVKESLAHSILITWSFAMSFPQRLATCILAFASFRFGSCENRCRLSLLTFMNQFRHPNTAIDTSYIVHKRENYIY